MIGSLGGHSAKEDLSLFYKFLLKNYLYFRLSFCSSESLYLYRKDKRFEIRILGKEDFVDSDFLLIRKMKQGEETAFDLFVHKYYKEILTYCSYHCPDKTYAEDMTQETFVRFFANLAAYHSSGKTKNYLYTIACNLCKDYFKKIKDVPASETELSLKIESAEHPMEHALNKFMVERALLQLSPELREVVILYYFQELKLVEIADVLHISLSLVKYRLRQAKKQLKNILLKEGKHES